MSIPKPQELTPFGHALAGALGSVFSNAIVYPLDTAKTRIQAGRRKQTILQVILRIIKEEGIAGCYKGFMANMINSFSQSYAYFFFYSLVRGAYLKRLAKNGKAAQISTAVELALGAIAGGLAQIFTIPVAVIATRQQIGRSLQRQADLKQSVAAQATLDTEQKTFADAVKQPDAPSTLTKPAVEQYDDSFLGVAREIIREEGVGGLWLGIKPGLVLTVNPAITYGVFERIKATVQPGGGKLSPWTAFCVGATSKTLATVVTYPYIMAKIRVQARTDKSVLPSSSARGGPGSIQILREVLHDQGFKGWYQGMDAQITKAVLSQALLFVSKDQFELYALKLLALWARATS
ncbi:mitochondrial carrier [Auriculariales sp. MPI-PUGE-AT-0066]|nr:mitochondrial carrier [Auriculariales sp. MPI-PUGE-AT-0066]